MARGVSTLVTEAILALERDVDAAANARLDEVLRRVGLFPVFVEAPGRYRTCNRHGMSLTLANLGIAITRLKRRMDYDGWCTPRSSSRDDESRLREMTVRKKAMSRVFHATPCTCKGVQ